MKRNRVLIGILTLLIVLVALNYRRLTPKPLPRLQDTALFWLPTGNPIRNPVPNPTGNYLWVEGWYSSTQLLANQWTSGNWISIDTESGRSTPLLNTDSLEEASQGASAQSEFGNESLDATDLVRSKPRFLKQTPHGTVVDSCTVSPDGVKTAWITEFTAATPLERMLQQVFPRYHANGKMLDGVWIANRDGSDAHLLGTVEDSGTGNAGGVSGWVGQLQWTRDCRRLMCTFADGVYVLQMD